MHGFKLLECLYFFNPGGTPPDPLSLVLPLLFQSICPWFTVIMLEKSPPSKYLSTAVINNHSVNKTLNCDAFPSTNHCDTIMYTYLIMVVHTREVSPTLVTSNLDQPL